MTTDARPPVRPPRRTAGVVAPPPLLPLAVIAMAELLRWLVPMPMYLGSATWRVVIAAALLLASLSVAGAAVLALRRARTPVEPWKQTRAIVSTGPYALSRNPIYVALLGVQLAYAWARGNVWGVLLVPVSVLLLNWGVISREERYLRELFGAPYERYLARVRRWL